LSDIIFDDEKAKSYEAGIKIRGLQDRLRANAAIFYSEYENLQVSMFDGVASLIVGNAAESTSKGVELDAQFAATEHLSLSASVTYLDAAYDSYPAGPCAYGQGQVCDLSGKTLPYAPEWSGNLSARWEDTLANGWTYGLRAEAVYSDMFYTAGDLDPFVAQRAYWKYDASVSLTSPSGAWEFAIMGKNLTDEVTAHFGDDIPLSNVLGNNYQQYVDPPRTIALQVRYQLR
jgi:iron complex outermembrane receptor protein